MQQLIQLTACRNRQPSLAAICYTPTHNHHERKHLVLLHVEDQLNDINSVPHAGHAVKERAGRAQRAAARLAEAAVDALGHVDVVARGLARAVLALLRLNRDGLRGAHLRAAAQLLSKKCAT